MYFFHRRNNSPNGRKYFASRDKKDNDKLRSSRSEVEDEDEDADAASNQMSNQTMIQSSTSETYQNIPTITIGVHQEPSVAKQSILKEKEKVLWINRNKADSYDNSRRLGPNTNNIIGESLRQN